MYNILDVFSGADGGESFIRFKKLLQQLDNKAIEGDEAAIILIEQVHRFNRMLLIKD